MKRRHVLLAASATVAGFPALAQSSLGPRIVYFSGRSAETDSHLLEAFREGFKTAGYADDQNESITIHDHLVIGGKGHASFRSLGLLYDPGTAAPEVKRNLSRTSKNNADGFCFIVRKHLRQIVFAGEDARIPFCR